MKTLALALFMLWPMAANAIDQDFVKTGGGDINVIGTLGNETALTYDRNYYLVPSKYGMGKVSAILDYDPKTFTNVTFSTNAYSIGSATITATSHGMPTGLDVLYTKTAGTDPEPLVDQTTYFIIAYSANVIELATTSAQAFASDPIIMSSKTLSGTQTYTLSALAVTGDPVFTYSGSNDGTTFAALGISSTQVAGSAANDWKYDFSEYNYAVLKLAVTAPTAGAITFKNAINLKP